MAPVTESIKKARNWVGSRGRTSANREADRMNPYINRFSSLGQQLPASLGLPFSEQE